MNPNDRSRKPIVFLSRLLIIAVAASCFCYPQIQAPPKTREPGKPEQTAFPNIANAQTDVIVFDREGHFKEGISREQFSLFLDGTPQPIEYFEAVAAGSPEEESQWARARGEPAALSSRANPPGPVNSRAILFFVDDLHMSAASIARVRVALTHCIDTVMGPNDRVLVTTASKRIGFLQQLSSDKAALRAAVAHLVFVQPSIKDNLTPPMSEAQAAAIENDEPGALAAFLKAALEKETDSGSNASRRAERSLRARASSLTARSALLSEAMLSYLGVSLRCFAQAPGRKIAYVLSDGFYLRDRQSESVNLLLQTADIAVAGRIAIYTMNAHNLAPEPAPAAPAVQRSDGSEAPTPQQGLGMLAISTGGRFLRSSGTLAEAVAGTLAETSRYYILGWQFKPAILRSGNSKAVKVLVTNRPDLTVHLRQSSIDLARYVSKDPDTGAGTAARELLEALRAHDRNTALPTYLYCGYAMSKEGKPVLTTSLQTTFEVKDPGAIDLERDVDIEVLGAVFNDGGVTMGAFQGDLNFAKIVSVLQPARLLELTYTRAMELVPGTYQVRIAARDRKNPRLGSATEQCEVPPIPTDRLFLSSIYLLFPRTGAPSEGGADSGSPLAFRVNAKRRFATGSSLAYHVSVYSPLHVNDDLMPKVLVQSRIYRGEAVVLEEAARPLGASASADRTAVAYASQISLKGLTAGAYDFEITATDKSTNQSAQQRVTFWIE